MAEPIVNLDERQRKRLEKAEEMAKKDREKREQKNKPAFAKQEPETPKQEEQPVKQEEPQEQIEQEPQKQPEEKHHVDNPKLGKLDQTPRQGVPVSKEEAKSITKRPEVYIITKTVVKENHQEKFKEEEKPEVSLTEQSKERNSRGTGLLDSTASLRRVDTGEEVKITKPVFCIGKSEKFADFVITGSKVISRRHAEIVSRNGIYYIRDKNSTNGTFIDGMQLQPETEVEIKSRQRITLANVTIEFKEG